MVLDVSVVDEFKNTSSIHGLSRFGGPELYTRRRLIWIILVLSAAGGLLTFVILEFIHLSEHPTATNFKTNIKTKVDFPAVTVCNLNQVKRSVLDCLGKDDQHELTRVFYTLSEISIIIKRFSDLSAQRSTIPGNLLHSCAYNHSHQLNDMISYCHYKQKLVNCSDMFIPKLTEYGLCYTFNSEDNKKSESIGEGGGLRFFVNIEQHRYFFSHTIRAGIKVILHDPAEEPLPSLRGFLVGPGLSASCSIRKNTVSTLPSPYGSCHESENKLTGVGTYSEVTCYKRCFTDYIVRKCGCKHFFSIVGGNVEYCNSKQLMECYAIYQYNLTREPEILQNCSCPPNCKTVKYEASVSYAAFTSDFIAGFLFNQSILPTTDFIQSFIDLRLFYDTLIETEIEEIPEKSVGSILGTVGGQMGMFIGASVLSVVELVEFVCLLLTKGTQKVANIKRHKPDQDDKESTVKDSNI